jgi:hypothetical protein
MKSTARFLRQNALTLMLLLACCAICAGLFHQNIRHLPIPIAAPPVVAVDGAGNPFTSDDAVLDRIVPELRLEARPTVEEAIQVIARTAPCNISVNWRSLEAAGAGREALVPPAYGPYRNITVRQALSHLWKGKDLAIGFSVQDNVIVIDTQDNLAKDTLTLIYNVRDLLAAMVSSKEYATDQESADALSKMLTDFISSDSWRDNGGNVGSVREMMGLLIITQTPDNHRKIEALLDLLRRRGSIRSPTPFPFESGSAVHAPLTQPAETETPTANENDELQIYDVRDLIDLLARQPNLHDPNFPDESPRDAASREITETLDSTIAPDSWFENGGTLGMMHEAMGMLIVRQSRENQKAVRQVLEAMRTALHSLR